MFAELRITTPVQSMEALIKDSIMPKFKKALATFPISTQDHNLILWSLVMSWSDLLPAHLLAQTLGQIFFPRWLQVLEDWLKKSPSHEEVMAWYSDWKNSLPNSVSNLPGVSESLKQAQVAIRCKLTGGQPDASTEDHFSSEM